MSSSLQLPETESQEPSAEPVKVPRGRPKNNYSQSPGKPPEQMQLVSVKRRRGRPAGSGWRQKLGIKHDLNVMISGTSGNSTENIECLLHERNGLVKLDVAAQAKKEEMEMEHLVSQCGHEDGGISGPSQQQNLVMDVPFLSKVYPSDDISNMAGSGGGGGGGGASAAAEDTKRVKVGSYCVAPSLSMTLQAIINKHGDIAKDCQLESDYMRTPVLEGICKVVQDLQNIQFRELKQHHLKSFYSAVKDAERVNLNVHWLHQRLDELVQAVNSVNLKDSKRRRRQSLESIKKDLARKRVELEEIQLKIQELEVQLASETLEEDIMNITVTDITSNFEYFEHKCLTDGLL